MLAGLAAVLLVGVSNGHAAPVQNTAAETVSPFFSTGTSSNLSQNKTGFISLSGSGDDRQGDSGSASAQVDYGVIRLSRQFQGRGLSVTNATFADNVTLTAPRVALGTFGTFNYQISVGAPCPPVPPVRTFLMKQRGL